MTAARLYRWSVDRINGRFLSGWCFHRFFKARPITIAAAADDMVLGRFTNDRYRPDLAAIGHHPTGVCGFDFSLPDDFDPGRHRRFHLYFDACRSPVLTIDCAAMEHLRPRLSAPICFMHIPKTAGTSFNAFARGCFSGSRYFTHIERLDGTGLGLAVNQADYLAGHLPLYRLRELGAVRRHDLFTIIREPYAHLHSHLNYLRGVSAGSRVEEFYDFQHNETVKQLSHELNRVDFTDPARIRRWVDGLASYRVDFFDNVQTRYFLDRRPERVGADDLRQARANLDMFRAVGLTEAYDRFLDDFCRFAGLEPRPQELKSNKAERYRLFDLADPRVRDALLPLVRYDLDLHGLVEAGWRNLAG